MTDIDKPNSFYLGRPHDLAMGETHAEPLLYDSNDLTTHAVCVGMTGSGKTGLCVTLLEEAALDGIPAIAIDPKGDLGNLLLAFPKLEPSDFRPWVDPGEAARNQVSPDDFAASQAELWRKGLSKWDQEPDRIRRYCDAVERVIYTPGSSAGIPITVLKSFRAPVAELSADADAFNERVSSATSGLLALLGIDADPVRSPEHIFISKLLEAAWRNGHDLDLHRLIENIQRPPFDRVGVVDLESFYPATQRFQLAMSLNNLLAAPSFASWLQGEPLDVQRMLFSPSGKPRLAVVSIAHLDESQRMFFVTLLLNEVLSWVRTQPGTSSLRALLYMDEVFGYFPPLANPPSKRPMLTLLKQARAYGLGCVLATQNPVDLDYKGLSNAGTWFLGRLQTERDKARVIEGLEGASAEAGSKFNRQQMEATLAALGKRVFLMNNVHNESPVVFQTRWAMSYLCGPLTRGQIKTLMDPVRSNFQSLTTSSSSSPAAEDGKGSSVGPAAMAPTSIATRTRPVLPAGIPERFATARDRVGDNCRLEYRPAVVGNCKVHFVQAASGIDHWLNVALLKPAEDSATDDFWAGATTLAERLTTGSQSEAGADFAELPTKFAREKSYQQFRRDLAEHLYRTFALELWQNEMLDLTSKVGESESEFRRRLEPAITARRATEAQQIERQFAAKLSRLEDRIRAAESKAATQKWQFWTRAGGFLWVLVEGAMRIKGLGRRGRPRSATSAMRTMATERGQQASAQANLEKLISEKQDLEQERDEQLLELDSSFDPQRLGLQRIEIKPRKSDIEVDSVALIWLPCSVDDQGRAKPLYEAVTPPNVDNESARAASPKVAKAGEPLARG
jgi:hypothetical protein